MHLLSNKCFIQKSIRAKIVNTFNNLEIYTTILSTLISSFYGNVGGVIVRLVTILMTGN